MFSIRVAILAALAVVGIKADQTDPNYTQLKVSDDIWKSWCPNGRSAPNVACMHLGPDAGTYDIYSINKSLKDMAVFSAGKHCKCLIGTHSFRHWKAHRLTMFQMIDFFFLLVERYGHQMRPSRYGSDCTYQTDWSEQR
ncbi:hypothetical protein BCV70DRAFT_62693 [Testicularia cyperi]|uniref:Uncharacterized protein n=1 Tax=Testicularia cyperi TaxID=1882483 RepID=A0A317XWY9_9BASI|nr:hypothetical protein BCV70DRAFT_62693 [Testicularia cyperi]